MAIPRTTDMSNGYNLLLQKLKLASVQAVLDLVYMTNTKTWYARNNLDVKLILLQSFYDSKEFILFRNNIFLLYLESGGITSQNSVWDFPDFWNPSKFRRDFWISGGISLDLWDFKKFDIERYVLQLNPFCKIYPFHSNEEGFSRISVQFLL